jgi:preprotein translocase subunit SecG
VTTVSRFDSRRAARLLARTTAVAAVFAVVTSIVVIVMTGSVGVALFSVFAAVGGAYAANVGWRSL